MIAPTSWRPPGRRRRAGRRSAHHRADSARRTQATDVGLCEPFLTSRHKRVVRSRFTVDLVTVWLYRRHQHGELVESFQGMCGRPLRAKGRPRSGLEKPRRQRASPRATPYLLGLKHRNSTRSVDNMLGKPTDLQSLSSRRCKRDMTATRRVPIDRLETRSAHRDSALPTHGIASPRRQRCHHHPRAS